MKTLESRVVALEESIKPPVLGFAERLEAALVRHAERMRTMTAEERHQDDLRELARLEADPRTMRSAFGRELVAALRRVTRGSNG